MERFIKILSSTFLILAGVLIASKICAVWIAYLLFIIGHLMYIGLFLYKKEYELMVANIGFICIDFIGLYCWIQ